MIFISVILRLSLFKLFFGGAIYLSEDLVLTVGLGRDGCGPAVVDVAVLHNACHLLEQESVLSLDLREASLHEGLFLEVPREAPRALVLDHAPLVHAAHGFVVEAALDLAHAAEVVLVLNIVPFFLKELILDG